MQMVALKKVGIPDGPWVREALKAAGPGNTRRGNAAQNAKRRFIRVGVLDEPSVRKVTIHRVKRMDAETRK